MEKESFFASILHLSGSLWFIAEFSTSYKEIPSENVTFTQSESHDGESLEGVHSFMKPSRILQFNERSPDTSNEWTDQQKRRQLKLVH